MAFLLLSSFNSYCFGYLTAVRFLFIMAVLKSFITALSSHMEKT